MKYVSTRNSTETFEFKDVFIKGLADDGGLFIPRSLEKFSITEINSLQELEYNELAKKIISTFGAQLATIDRLDKETLEPIVNDLIKSNDTNFKGVGQPLRIALTGSKFGPGIYDIIISLGKEELTKRLTNKKFS